VSAQTVLARAVAVAFASVLGLAVSGCGGDGAATPEGKCIGWVTDVQEGNVSASAELSELAGSVDEPDFVCYRASQLEIRKLGLIRSV
jgi:hypothetical protein